MPKLPSDAVPVQATQQSSGLPADAVPVQQQAMSGMSDMFQIDTTTPPEETKDTKSALNLADDLAYSFANNKRSYLEKKFGYVNQDDKGNYFVGTSPLDAKAVSPQGVTTDLFGKLIRHLNDINVIGQSIVGAMLGAEAGPGGAMAGAAAAGALGEKTNQMIGQSLGVNNQAPDEAARDIVISAMASGAGEGVGQGIVALSKATIPVAMKIMGELLGKGGQEGKSASIDMVSKIFNFFSGIDKKHTLNVLSGELGTPEAILAARNGTDMHLKDISQNVMSTFAKKDAEMQGMVRNAKHALESASGGTEYKTMDLQKNLLDSMRRIGIIDENNYYVKSHGIGDSAKKFLDFFENLGGKIENVETSASTGMKEGRIVSIPGSSNRELVPNPIAKASVGKMYGIDTRIGALYEGLDTDNPLKQSLKSVAQRFRYGGESPLYQGDNVTGVKQLLHQIADHLGVESYAKSNQTFSQFRKIVEGLENVGVNVNNPRQIENMVQGIAQKSPAVMGAIDTADKNFGTQFGRDIKIYDTAAAFKNTNPKLFRFGIAAGLLGLTPAGGASFQNKLSRIGAAYLLASPAGNRLLITHGSALMRALPNLSPDMQSYVLKAPAIQRSVIQALSRMTTRSQQSERKL